MFKSLVNNTLKYFSHVKCLREEREHCINNMVNDRDVFVILPTGFGKSLIFQLFPRVMSSMNGKHGAVCTIIVVSPLLAIIKDQVRNRRIKLELQQQQ